MNSPVTTSVHACCRYLKRRLALATAANDPGDKNWLQHIQPIVDDYNSRPVTGCSMRRDAVTQQTELKLLAQKLGADDVTPIFNTRLLRGVSAKTMQTLGFKYNVGDGVLVANEANYETTARLAAGGGFAKKSVVGHFGTKVYTVSEGFLKANDTHYLMVYHLKGLQGIFYDHDLTPATFAGRGPEAEQAAAALQATRDVKLRAQAAAQRQKAARWK